MNCRVFYNCWEMQCCGDPFKIDDTIRWTVVKERQLMLSGDTTLGDLDYFYEAHDHTAELFNFTGVVKRIWGLYEKFEPSDKDPNFLLIPIHGELIEIDSVDGWEEPIGELEITGYVVELEDCSVTRLGSKE
ncbi:MAG: hypothetical protein K2N06_05935 [Oscillospiraceae bacterium]|nr:hypothetical protein [Oscillospiraceae bacterium]